jgi:ubiquinol-cytochrome c reductase subunit 6
MAVAIASRTAAWVADACETAQQHRLVALASRAHPGRNTRSNAPTVLLTLHQTLSPNFTGVKNGTSLMLYARFTPRPHAACACAASSRVVATMPLSVFVIPRNAPAHPSCARFPPSCVQAESAVDPKARIEKECHKPCEREWKEYEKCKERIKAKGEGSCEPWSFDYWKCVDKCVSQSQGRAAWKVQQYEKV